MKQIHDPNTQSHYFEILSRISTFSALALFVVYAIGFIVTSLHYASYGIPQSNPFKSQVLAAGLWAVALLGGPVVLALRTRPQKKSLAETLRSMVWNYALVYLLVGIGGAVTFDRDNRFWPSNFTIFVVLFALALLKRFHRWERFYKWQAIASSAALFGWLIYLADKPASAATTSFWLTMWGGISIFLFTEMKSGSMNREYTVIISAGMFVALLAGFAATLYPRIQYSWGGGKPIPILMCLSKTSDILPGRQIRTDLLEQSSDGFYVIDGANKKAVLIPHSAVSWVYYGDKAFDPKNLAK